MTSRGGIAVVGAVPPEAEGSGPRTAAALIAALAARDVRAWPVLLADDDAVSDALATADAIVLVDPRPTHAELTRVARLGSGPARLVLVPSGYAFCEIAVRTCDRCPIKRGCPASDRVAIYRALAARADLVIYASPLHREASEAFVGAYPERTLVIPPPGVPVLADRPQTTDAISFVGGDPVEWTQVLHWAATNPDRALVVHGAPPPGLVPPANVTLRPPLGAAAQLEVLAAARTLVVLPGHPLPFGIAAATARRAGIEVVGNAALGLASHGWTTAVEAEHAIATAASVLADAVTGVARRGSREITPPTALGRVLLYIHHVGLGDSINLWSLAQALLDAGMPVTFAVPDAHHALLCDQLPAATVAIASALDLESARSEHDLVVEITIRAADAFAGDLVEDRWLQLTLDRQPSAMMPMHEQFLSLFARAGHALVPRRPELRLREDELARGRSALVATGIDPDRELVVALHPGAGNPGKRWAVDRFADLVRRLRTRGARVIVVGGRGEDALVDEVAAAGADLASKSAPLREVAALLGAATLVIANDSGLMHVASAVGVPTLGIFGPTSERLWGPTHRYAAGVRARGGGDPRGALAVLAVDEVERAAIALARQVAGEPPLAPDRRFVASPRVERVVLGDTVEWRGRAVVAVTGAADPIAAIVAACATAPTWTELVAVHDPDVLAALLAAEVIVPTWAAGGALQ